MMMTQPNEYVAVRDIPGFVLVNGPDSEQTVKVSVDFYYSPDDPVAIKMIVRGNDGSEAPWEFSRDLLALGANSDTRIVNPHGDVKIWSENSATIVHLSSPSGEVYIRFLRSTINLFLTRTYMSVPVGFEFDSAAMDIELDRILREGV